MGTSGQILRPDSINAPYAWSPNFLWRTDAPATASVEANKCLEMASHMIRNRGMCWFVN
ncbi:hypothetical protein RE6C_00922 [Rhodopirellula europaea 6C]|uniref:Uncharacterized protein n=1 Tax=Rhodopirellula europaea 6C TaxID=1263867 RepID=M2B9I1_9BACT|nr:hypothetical protein RE6C_00922 [Rhodopirellula europaea 6C]